MNFGGVGDQLVLEKPTTVAGIVHGLMDCTIPKCCPNVLPAFWTGVLSFGAMVETKYHFTGSVDGDVPALSTNPSPKSKIFSMLFSSTVVDS